MRILGIETSCDDTGVAIYDQCDGLLVNYVYSQNKLHADYGGVVPELAARDHISKIIPLIISALQKIDYRSNNISGIAYTAGPGLVGSLMVGSTIAEALAYSWKIPAIAIHHMEAHLLSPIIDQPDVANTIRFPCISLLVSGGHTQLVLVKNIGEYKILGESMDDAVGEVFDKVSVLLGLKYPGGSELARIARKGSERYVFPRPMINHRSNLNFSFSGLKTAVARLIMSTCINDPQVKADIACSFEKAIVDTLVIKCRQAIHQTKVNRLIVSGGVSANESLRLNLSKMIQLIKGRLFYPKLEFCTDNGAMVAYTGLIRFKSGSYDSCNLSISVKSRWSLESLSKVSLGLL